MTKVLSLIDSEKYLLIILDLMFYHFDDDCVVDIAISDSIKNVSVFVERLKAIGLFNEVFIISHKTEDEKTGKYGKFIAKFLRNIHFSKKSIQKKLHILYPMLDFNYDNIVYYDDWYLNNLIALSQNKLKKFIWIDDGLSSYCGNTFEHKGTFSDKIRSLFKVRYLRDSISEQYLFKPEFRQYSSEFECKALHPFNLTDEKFLNAVNLLFGIHEKFSFNEKFIYIDQPFEDDGLSYSNNHFLEKICIEAEKDSILVKPHPRSNTEQYRNKYKTFEINSIPWELILMNKEKESSVNILIGSMSTALLSPFLFFNDKTPVVILLNYFDISKLPQKFIKQMNFIKSICEKYPEVFYVPKNDSDLKEIILKLKEYEIK